MSGTGNILRMEAAICSTTLVLPTKLHSVRSQKPVNVTMKVRHLLQWLLESQALYHIGNYRNTASQCTGFIVAIEEAATCFGYVQGGADKSLARPERKQTKATKLWIYSTYSPRSSIHFLARCYNFCKPLKKKKNSEGCPSNQVSAAAMTSASDQKWRPFNCFLVQGTGGSPMGPDQENRVGDQENGSPGRPVSSGLQELGEQEHCRARPRTPW